MDSPNAASNLATNNMSGFQRPNPDSATSDPAPSSATGATAANPVVGSNTVNNLVDLKKDVKSQHFVLPSISDLSGESSHAQSHVQAHNFGSHTPSPATVGNNNTASISSSGNPMLPHQPLRLPSVTNPSYGSNTIIQGFNANDNKESDNVTSDAVNIGGSVTNVTSNGQTEDLKSSGRKSTSGFSVASFDNPLPPARQQDNVPNSPYQGLQTVQQQDQQQDQQQQQQQQEQKDAYYRPLNVKDALSYLEQVKFQFNSRPDVYNHFLDIMKDFKSQAIDTPGVIERVSTLFRGFPNLIQGFNTFLPQGYRIECSANPDEPIRVTTPMGSSIVAGSTDTAVKFSEKSHVPNLPQENALQTQQGLPEQDLLGKTKQLNQAVTIPTDSTQSQMQTHLSQDYHLQPQREDQAQLNTHQNKEQQLPDTTRKTADVEFSQAICYVNKIKNRFADQPDIYKHFLEILQTYQREQKPINEVYAQVTLLFQNAPDLLDDFKKFLPDSSTTMPSQHSPPQQQLQGFGIGNYYADGGINGQQNLPPLGSFSAPTNGGNVRPFYTEPHSQSLGLPSVTPTDAQIDQNVQPHIITQGLSNEGIQVSNLRSSILQNSTEVAQYPQQQQPVPAQQEGPYFDSAVRPEIDLDPSIVPVVPEPTEPIEDSLSLVEETNFFDKAKKFIGNKQIYTEFLKFLNLFSQDLYDVDELVEKVEHYLGGNKDLFTWFKNFVGFQDKPKHIENIVHEKHRLDLDLCEACGPSYKKLPKADTFMPCSGRDEMCWEVLNDEWVGHPVWASEDSGFIAHRKNQYEETLFKIEEERHEYDFYIESNLRTIQTLETIASKIANMTEEEKADFKLPPGLGHTSLTIYKKVIRKIYDKERGFEIIDALHEYPAVAVPVVLKRLKQKDEEWRRAQREWNKVWRELEQKVYFKSLDHLGLTFKQADKKLLTTKQLISEISSIKVDQTNKRMHWLTPKPKSQLSYSFPDKQVLYDILGLAEILINHSSTYSNPDKERLKDMLKGFISLFFSIPLHDMDAALAARTNQGEEDVEYDESNVNGSSITRKRTRETEIPLKDILHRTKYQRVKSRANGGAEANDSPPEELTGSLDEEETNNGEEETLKEEAKKPWLLGNLVEEANAQGKISNRKCFNLFANTNIYVFFRHLTTLFERLYEVKQINKEVTKEINGRKVVQFAKDLNLISQQMKDMGLDFGGTDAYEQLVNLCKRLIEGDIEHQWFEESLRQAYNNKAFKLYTVDKVVQALVKHAHTIMTDSKTAEIMILFEKDRLQIDTSAKDQILYRLQVRSHMSSIENMFRIDFNRQSNHVCIQYIAVDDLTLAEPKSLEDKWKYYVTSYSLSHPTEGIAQEELQIPFLERIIEDEEEYDDEGKDGENSKGRFSPEGVSHSTLKIKINPETYALDIEPGSCDVFSRRSMNRFPNSIGRNFHDLKKQRKIAASKKFLDGKNGWKKNLGQGDIPAFNAKLAFVKKTGSLEGFSQENNDISGGISTVGNPTENSVESLTDGAFTKGPKTERDNDEKGNDTTTEDIDLEVSVAH